MTVEEFVRELKQRVRATESLEPYSHEELDALRDIGVFVRRHKTLLDWCVCKSVGDMFGRPVVIDDALILRDVPEFGPAK